MRYKVLFLLLLIPGFLSAYFPCHRLQLPGWWGEFDYILLWSKERFYPPLVTTGDMGILGEPGTSILFGDEKVGHSPHSGGRLDLGFWLTRCLGFGTTFFAVDGDEVDFSVESDLLGAPLLARPFFNILTDLQDSFVVSDPDILLRGEIDVETTNRFWGSDCYVRYRIFCAPCVKFDVIGGFMFTFVKDSLDINNTSTEIIDNELHISDQFNAENNFYSGLLGVMAEFRGRCYAIQVIAKAGFGNMIKKVGIEGATIARVGGIIIEELEEGLLARPSNRGKHTVNGFEIVPHIITNLQLSLCPHLWCTLGYMYIYWPRVALAGEQVNLNIIPPPLPGPEPVFRLKNRCFWAQGLVAGVYLLY